MDQRVNGEPPPPPTSASSLDTPPAPRDPGQVEQVLERRSKSKNSENGDVGDSGSGKEEKKGAGRKREAHKGAVLELLIEGRCGSAGQQQLQISSKETSCPEGNVRLRIGLQAKRTKKPPKILESYVCKPTVRTYQRQGRGQPPPLPPPPKADGGTGGAGQQCKSRPAADRSARDRCSGLDTVQLASRQPAATAAAASQAFASSSSSPASTSTTSATVSTTASLPGVNNPGSRSSKQVPVKLADKGEVNSIGSSDRAKKEKLPGASSQTDPAEQKSCSPVAERTTSVSSSASLVQVYPASEARNEGNTSKKHNGLVVTTKKKGQANGKSSISTLGSDPSSKLKAGKQSSSSSVRPPGSSGANKDLGRSGKSEAGSPCSLSADPRPQLSPARDLSPARLQNLDPFLRASLEKKREKERRAKRERVKDKKSKRNVSEADGALSEVRGGGESGEDGRKKRTEKRKQGRKDGNDGRKADDTKQDELETNGGNGDKEKDGLSPDRTEEQLLTKCGEAVNLNTKPDRGSRAQNPGSPNEAGTVAEPATGDSCKSKELGLTKHISVAPPPSSSHPLPHPHSHSSAAPAPRSPREQDSRPLKKRKTRRPSWTKLVQRAQRAESLDTTSSTVSTTSSSTSSSSSTFSSSEAQPRTLSGASQSAAVPAKLASFQQTDESLRSTTSCRISTSSSSIAPRFTMTSVTPVKRRGRPKSHSSSFGEPPSRISPGEHEDAHKASTLSELPRKILQGAPPPLSTPSPKKRGRPPKRPFPEDQAEVGDRQLKIRRLIDEMKKRKKRRKLHEAAKEGRGARVVTGVTDVSPRSLQAATVQSLAALSSSFGSRLGPQINVSKRGTIYMGKRRGRKPKSQTPPALASQGGSQTSSQSPLFPTPSEVSLFSHPPPSHPFPSPSLTHSSGAQSPYSEGGLTEPTSSSLLFSHPFSLPSPSTPCTSPRLPPSSSTSPSLSPFVKRSCPCQGRPHFPFHQSSCKLHLSPAPSLPPPLQPLHHHAPGSPVCPKDAAPSPRSESHSEETLPSDSGIGTDNNSVSERGGEAGATRGVRRPGQGSGVRPGGGPMHPPSASSPLCRTSRHMNPIGSPASAERHRDRHRHRRRDYQCSTTVGAPPCSCLCRCSYPGHKCPHSDFYPCLGHSTAKRQKSKHKKKHQQQLHMQDPEFLADLEDVIGQLGEIHIGRRGWARAGLEQSFESGGGGGGGGGGGSSGGSGGGGRRHHHHSSSSHSLRSNIFRINLNGYYSPHPASHPASYFPPPPPPFYTCQPLHCGRKAERRQCGCPSNFQETVDNLGFYSYHHLPASYTLPSPHQQPHHAHFIINPARFHRRRSRLLREGALGGDLEGDLDSGSGGGAGGGGGGGGGGGLHLGPGFTPGLSCGCVRGEHKPKHKHRHRHCERDLEDEEEELNEDEEEEEEEDRSEGGGLTGVKYRSGFMVAAGSSGGGRKASRGGTGGTTLSRESPWIREKRSDSFSAAAAAAAAATATAAKSMSSSADRYKHTALTSLGLGSTHLSSFGGGWGGLGQSWTQFGSSTGTGFPNSMPGFRGFNGEQRVSQLMASEGEEEDDVLGSHPYKAPRSHTNLFTSAAVEKGGRGLRSRWASRTAGASERSWRTEEPAWTKRREAALQGDWSGHRGQQRSTPAQHGNNNSGGEVNKRRPGRPRKHPLPITPTTPTQPPAAASVSSPDLLLPGQRRLEPDPHVDAAAEEEELQAARKKAGRKRKHDESPFHQSITEDEPDDDAGPECLGRWDGEQREEEAEPTPPRKNFLRAGLYSDDYKTADPPTYSQQQLCRDSVMEFTPDERDYSLLPAPIHVGKYLRLKRIHFQLPYDVMWLWQHNQLHRPPSVPLKRKRRYCRLKERRLSSRQTAQEGSSDIASLFPHINMEPLTASERSFVLQHHVFLVRNWKLVRDKQIRLRVERQRDEEEEEEEEDEEGEEDDEEEEGEEVGGGPQPAPCDGSVASDNHIKSDQRRGAEVALTCSDPHLHHRQCQDAPSSPAASPCATANQLREEEEREEEGEEEEDEETRAEEEACSREQRRKRLNDLLLTLQHS